MSKIILPAEWEEQDGVLLAWPHEDTDWHPILPKVEPVYTEVVRQISLREKVVVVAPDETAVRNALGKVEIPEENVLVCSVPTNDTWARDFGPVIVRDGSGLRIVDFGFNGWGLKFAANHDNQVTRTLYDREIFCRVTMVTPGLILEGGSIESDGAGTILTTASCLLNPNRNPHLSRAGVEDALGDLLGADKVLWLEHGFLAGDDTDSHVDTLARLCPCDTILHVACDDPTDIHFAEIQSMVVELKEFRTREGKPYRLIPLPWPRPRFADDGHRLPATYANFLVINGAVLVPTYSDPSDATALAAVGQAFPGREIIGIDCLPLIQQHGSLHCITMQLPRGVLS